MNMSMSMRTEDQSGWSNGLFQNKSSGCLIVSIVASSQAGTALASRGPRERKKEPVDVMQE
jgi:hypothetical protein